MTRILLVHIPKTAGSSLFEALQRWSGSEKSEHVLNVEVLRAIPAARLDELLLLGGHVSLQGFQKVIGDGWQPVTVLREPVSRILSDYAFVRRTPGHPWYDQVSEMTADDFVGWLMARPNSINQQCLLISGKPDAAESFAILKERFLLASSIEHLDPFVGELSKHLEFELELPHTNRATWRISSEALRPETLALVHAGTEQDAELHRLVNEAGIIGHASAPAAR